MMPRARREVDARATPESAAAGARGSIKGRRTVPVTAGDLVGVRGVPAPADEPFLDLLVARLAAQYGLDPPVVRSLAVQVLASFAGASVRSFVPILVEKRTRELCRRFVGPGAIPGDHEEPTAVVG
jgi:hypothetical protein